METTQRTAKLTGAQASALKSYADRADAKVSTQTGIIRRATVRNLARRGFVTITNTGSAWHGGPPALPYIAITAEGRAAIGR